MQRRFQQVPLRYKLNSTTNDYRKRITPKQATLGVRITTLQHYGAVSAQTVQEMAEGALHASERASHALAISGIAGPDGATPEKPVGLVWFGLALRPSHHRPTQTDYQIFKGERADIRTQAVYYAIKLIAAHL